MSDIRGPTPAANKLAMSKALGAAFLNHQVEQLEKSVSGNRTEGNWRDRRFRPGQERQGNANRRPQQNGGGPRAARPKSGAADRTEGGVGAGVGDRVRKDDGPEKDADVVVVDASVLVHALPQVKKWCRDGRKEIVIVPLEALNTLDLLKKGTTALAQRARAASRILEAQVGTNPRIRVQRDDAFVLWDSIPFKDTPATAGIGTTITTAPTAGAASPEWVRRTICCARWELEHAAPAPAGAAPRKTVLAVLAPTAAEPHAEPSPAQTAISASPVPLPAPQPNRFEPRSAGTLVAQWGARAGLDVFFVTPAPHNEFNTHSPGGRRSPEDDRAPRGGRGRRGSHHSHKDGRTTPSGGGGLVERPPAVMAMMEMVSQPSRVVRVLARGEKLEPN